MLIRTSLNAAYATGKDQYGDVNLDQIDKTLLNLFADTLEAHIRFEERELFNQLQQLPTEVLETLPEAAAHNSRAIDDNWEDCFWK